MWTPLGPTQSVLIRELSLFQGLFNILKILLGPHPVSALQSMSLFLARWGSTVEDIADMAFTELLEQVDLAKLDIVSRVYMNDR